MSYLQNRDFYLEVMKGNVSGQQIVNKFGRNPDVGTALVHVSIGGFYQTPTTAQSLEVLSADANDNPAGAGGHKITIQGLDANFDIQSEEVTLNGTTPVALVNTYMRVFRGFISESGSYVTTSVPSHTGQITLRNSGAGVTWFIIDTATGVTTSGFGIGQTQIGTYTVPAGFTAYVLTKSFSVESTKTAKIYLFKRNKGDDVTTPFTGTMRLFEQNDGIAELSTIDPKAPIQMIEEKSEVGFFALAASAATSISVEFQLLLVQN